MIINMPGKFSQVGKTGDDHWASCWVYPFVQREGVDGCIHLLFEEGRPCGWRGGWVYSPSVRGAPAGGRPSLRVVCARAGAAPRPAS